MQLHFIDYLIFAGFIVAVVSIGILGSRHVGMGRILVGVFTVPGCSLAPMLGDPRIGNSIFAIIQEGQAYIRFLKKYERAPLRSNKHNYL